MSFQYSYEFFLTSIIFKEYLFLNKISLLFFLILISHQFFYGILLFYINSIRIYYLSMSSIFKISYFFRSLLFIIDVYLAFKTNLIEILYMIIIFFYLSAQIRNYLLL